MGTLEFDPDGEAAWNIEQGMTTDYFEPQEDAGELFERNSRFLFERRHSPKLRKSNAVVPQARRKTSPLRSNGRRTKCPVDCNHARQASRPTGRSLPCADK